MPRKPKSKEKTQFLVGHVDGLSRTLIYADSPKGAAREWCRRRTKYFWENHNTVVLRVDKKDTSSSVISDTIGEPSFWIVNANQPPAWIIEWIPAAPIGDA